MIFYERYSHKEIHNGDSHGSHRNFHIKVMAIMSNDTRFSI